jgi:hypothetical protein
MTARLPRCNDTSITLGIKLSSQLFRAALTLS